jgi:hypothetical protein
MRITALFLLSAFAAMAVSKSEGQILSGQSVSIGSHRLYIQQMGEGSPTVVIDAGKSDKPEEKARAVFFRTIASEHVEMFGESARLAGSIESFGDIPPSYAPGQPVDHLQRNRMDTGRLCPD